MRQILHLGEERGCCTCSQNSRTKTHSGPFSGFPLGKGIHGKFPNSEIRTFEYSMQHTPTTFSSLVSVQYEKGNKPENRYGKICFMEQKLIKFDCNMRWDRWLNWESGDVVEGKACMAGSVYSSVGLPSEKIKCTPHHTVF